MADPKPKMIKATVAKGRTIRLGGAPIYDADNKAIGHDDGQDFGPGAEVEVSEGEYKGLVAAGFLNNPEVDQPVILTGPKIQITEDAKR